jgi:predicted TIM-barrel fold metal-dependent hydrolase
LARIGFGRAVIVQPSVYGFDNRCLLDALRALGGAARGVAVLPETVTDIELQQLDAAGVRGVRLNVESASERDPQALQRRLGVWAQRLAPLGWHVQIYAALDVIASVAGFMQGLAVPVVLDHFAMIGTDTPLNDSRVRSVLALVREGAVHVKLSAPYRIGGDTPAGKAGAAALAAALIQANAAQLLWGSDWPHTYREPGKGAHETSAYRPMDAKCLLDDIAAWLAERALRETILLDNPARLYRF